MLKLLAETKYHKYVKVFLENETDYRFIEELGVGSYGVAYLIEHTESHQKYVLKRMKAKHQSKEKLRQKFDLEIHLLKEIGLPNTPSVISQGEIKNIPFYIMDFIDGQTFEQAIFQDGHTFSLDQSLSITKQLLDYVVILHNKGIVHRDLRIPNILFKNNQLYIIDFGLASYISNNVTSEAIDNPKRAQNHISDLYFIGHFLLFLLYSTYTPTIKKELSWQQELQLPEPVVHYIERLLLLKDPFSSADEALSSMPLEYASSTH